MTNPNPAAPEKCPRCKSSDKAVRNQISSRFSAPYMCTSKWHDVLPVEPQAVKCGDVLLSGITCTRPLGHGGTHWSKELNKEASWDRLAAEPVPVVPPAQIEEGFQVNIVCHTADAQQRMSDPENLRFKIGMTLDALGLQEEVDYTLEVRRTYESK